MAQTWQRMLCCIDRDPNYENRVEFNQIESLQTNKQTNKHRMDY